MNELQQALGAEIRNQRQIIDITQEEFSRRCTLSRASIANIERGRQSVTMETFYKLSSALNMDPGALLNNIIRKAFPNGDKSISLAEVDNKPDVFSTVNKYI